MRLYDYYCKGCDDFEERLIYSTEDAEEQFCIDCNIKMERQVSAPMGYVPGTKTPTKR